jgi:predicted transcriptional regulator of viral defense system
MLSADGRSLAAVLAAGPDAALSYGSAGAHWGLRPAKGSRLHVTTARQLRSRSNVQFHRDRLPRDEVTVVRGVPVTTVPRTLFDLAAVLDRHRLERAANEAEARRLADPLSLDDLLLRYPRRPGRKR